VRNLSFDTETELIAPGRYAPRLICGSFYDGDFSPWLELRAGTIKTIGDALEDSETRIIGLNLAFDLAVVCQAEPALLPTVFDALDAGRFWDVGLFERLKAIALNHFRLDPQIGRRPSFSLAELSSKYLGKDRSVEKNDPNSWRLRYAELDGIPLEKWPQAAKSYALDDAKDPFEIYEKQAREGTPPLFKETHSHAFALHLMAAWGIRTDPAAVAALKKRLQERVDAATPQLIASGILRENGSENTNETKKRVLAALGSAAPLTKSGEKLASERDLTEDERIKYTKTSADVLEECGRDPALSLRLDIAKDRDELSNFVPRLELGTVHPINARFSVLVSTGRTACSKPNLQNNPRRSGVRECFVPRPGFVFVFCDYHVAELCSLAQTLIDLFGGSKMADEINAGRDLHVAFAAGLAGVSYEDALTRYKAGDKTIKELRQVAKAANFGYPGGLSAARFVDYAASMGVEISEAKSKEIRSAWLDSFPEMRRYFDWIASQTRTGSFEHIHPRTGFIRGGVSYCDGCNQGFQHLTAIGAKDALFSVARECYSDPSSPLFGSRPVVFVHDEIIIEAPETRLTAAAARLESIMVDQMRRYTPDVDCKATAAAARRWYKDAQPVVLDGELLPWTCPTPVLKPAFSR